MAKDSTKPSASCSTVTHNFISSFTLGPLHSRGIQEHLPFYSRKAKNRKRRPRSHTNCWWTNRNSHVEQRAAVSKAQWSNTPGAYYCGFFPPNANYYQRGNRQRCQNPIGTQYYTPHYTQLCLKNSHNSWKVILNGRKVRKYQAPFYGLSLFGYKQEINSLQLTWFIWL